MSERSSTAPNPPICRSSSPRPSSWSSISTPPRRSASPCRHRSSPAPTRSSNEPASGNFVSSIGRVHCSSAGARAEFWQNLASRRADIADQYEQPRIRDLPLGGASRAKQGYVEGGNLVVEIRVGAPDKLPELARELVATRPDVVIAVSSWGIEAVRQASPTTPIVGSFIGIDPIAAGYAT